MKPSLIGAGTPQVAVIHVSKAAESPSTKVIAVAKQKLYDTYQKVYCTDAKAHRQSCGVWIVFIWYVHIPHRCAFCQKQINRDVDVWVDDTGGDVCGVRNEDNRNHPHVPKY